MKTLIAAAALAAFFALSFEPARSPAAARVNRFDPNPAVDAIFLRACADCHSSATRWPWFSRIPPASWLLRRDIQNARARLDLSARAPVAFNQREEILDAVSDGSMPPRTYLFMHPGARLSPADLAALNRWSR